MWLSSATKANSSPIGPSYTTIFPTFYNEADFVASNKRVHKTKVSVFRYAYLTQLGFVMD